MTAGPAVAGPVGHASVQAIGSGWSGTGSRRHWRPWLRPFGERDGRRDNGRCCNVGRGIVGQGNVGRGDAGKTLPTRPTCRPRGWRAVRRNVDGIARPIENVREQPRKVAAVEDDGQGQFPPQRVSRHNAEIAADIGNHGADRTAAERGRDVPRRWHANNTGSRPIGASFRRSDSARLTVRRGAGRSNAAILAAGADDQPGFEFGGAMQTADDTRNDQPEIGGAEIMRDVVEVCGGPGC